MIVLAVSALQSMSEGSLDGTMGGIKRGICRGVTEIWRNRWMRLWCHNLECICGGLIPNPSGSFDVKLKHLVYCLLDRSLEPTVSGVIIKYDC